MYVCVRLAGHAATYDILHSVFQLLSSTLMLFKILINWQDHGKGILFLTLILEEEANKKCFPSQLISLLIPYVAEVVYQTVISQAIAA